MARINLKSEEQRTRFLQRHDWEYSGDAFGPVGLYYHPKYCQWWVEKNTAITLTLCRHIDRLEHELEEARAKLRKRKKDK